MDAEHEHGTILGIVTIFANLTDKLVTIIATQEKEQNEKISELKLEVSQLQQETKMATATLAQLQEENAAMKADLATVQANAKTDYDFLVSEIDRLKAEGGATPEQLGEILTGMQENRTTLKSQDLDPSR